ncbi:TerD family protein [Streptomyces sp. NPDC001985]|uniref:TerD family protein n=1 Tax=Streptomyces sp. NPDC001985 TaxID=3154406 RepID=UPI00331FFBD2
MAREFQRGHKARISDLTAGTDLYVGVQISSPGLTFDISCFGLDAHEQLSDDRYFIFFNQPKSPEESIQLLGAQAGDTESFRVTLDAIPAHIHKLSFTATLDGDGQMSRIGPGYIRIVAGGEEVVRYPFDGSEFTTERAVMLGDFYLKDVWRFAAIGQGFDGGLEALLKNFGGEVAEEEPAAQPPPPPGAAPAFAPPPAAPAAPVPPPAPSFGAPVPPPVVPAPVPPVPPAPTVVVPPAPPGAMAPPPPFGQVPGPAVAPPGPPAPFGGQAPAPYAQPPGAPQGTAQALPAAGPGLQAALQPYRESPTGQRWTLQSQHLMRVEMAMGGSAVLARHGSMVMYQGKVDFSHKGAGFVGRRIGNATGQEMQLMRCTGRGQVFLAEDAAHLHPIELQGDGICVSAENVLAFDEDLQYEIRRIEGHGIPGGALFTMQFTGTGTVVVKTHGTPVVLPVTPTTFADANAVVAWSSASQVILSSQVRLRRHSYPGHSGETVNLQFRGAPGNFIVVQPYEV